MYDSLVKAFDDARRRAQLQGKPVSRDEVMKAMYPVFSQYSKDAITSRQLDQNRELFDKNMAFQQKMIDDAKPINYANLIISGLGSLGAGISASNQEDIYRQKLNTLLKMYGGK